jgi:putative hemolysin
MRFLKENGKLTKLLEKFSIQNVTCGPLLEQALTLRKRIFFNALGKDEDAFDAVCNHLVAVDKETQKVIGTYRLLLDSVAKKNKGFYSETEFDLTNIKKNCKGELLELGRACVDPEYRKYPILPLIWGEIIKFIDKH